MTATTKLTSLAVAAGIAVSGAMPAVGEARATDTGRHTVTVESVYVYERAGVGFSGTLVEGNTFTVKRLSPSGKWAYGKAYGHVNRHVWVRASALDKASKRGAANARTGRHTVSAESTYLFKEAGKRWDGTLHRDETFDVKRLSPSGKWAYGKAFGHINRHGWVLAKDLNKKS
jgi:hypothetical protein